jgi:hypothetical protein
MKKNEVKKKVILMKIVRMETHKILRLRLRMMKIQRMKNNKHEVERILRRKLLRMKIIHKILYQELQNENYEMGKI